MSIVLVEVDRSRVVESIHRGDIAVVNTDGDILYRAGNTSKLTFFRSTAKPIIAVALMETGIFEKYQLELKEVAMIASSHSGEEEHIRVLSRLMKKAGMEEAMLQCGITLPFGKEAAHKLLASGKQPTQLHCNCSAKHAGMMAAAKTMGFSTDRYEQPEHPIQKYIMNVVSDFCSVEKKQIGVGVDGCGVPVYAIPLENMAFAYANLTDKSFLQGKYSKSQNYVMSAMTMFPEMVAGEGRFDTELMKLFGDRVLSKTGSEGVYCAGIPGKGIGIAFKIEDGNLRAVPPVAVEILIQIGIISREEAKKLTNYWNQPVLSHKGKAVGKIRTVFKLE